MALDQAPPAADLLVQTTSSQTISSSQSAGVQSVPAGAVMSFAGLTAPSGWLLCDGSAVSRTTYSSLFAVIGTTYGTGDGSTTFNLPDGVGRVMVGQGASGHTDVRTVGANDGVTQANRRPKHRTTITDPGHTHSVNYNAGASANGTVSLSGRDSAADHTFTPGTLSGTTGITAGTGVSADTLDTPAYIVYPQIIKT